MKQLELLQKTDLGRNNVRSVNETRTSKVNDIDAQYGVCNFKLKKRSKTWMNLKLLRLDRKNTDEEK